MSTQAVSGSINAPDALAARQRVEQLQALVAQAAAGTPTASFAATLAAASSGSSSGTAASTRSANPATALASTPTAALPSSSSIPAALPSSSAANGAGASSTYDSLISAAAARYGLNPAILHGLIQQESGFNANSRSSAGAAGLTQLMPATASSLGVSDPLDPAESIEGGARYLSQLMAQFGGNTTDALAAYNAGPGAVKQYGGVPPYAETQQYVTKVLGYANAYQQSQTATAATGTGTGTGTGQIS